MLFPKAKMTHASTYQGNRSEEGWLILDIGNMELEGVAKLYVDLNDVEAVKKQSKKSSDNVNNLKKLLGGE